MAGTHRRRAEAPPRERIRVLVADDHEVVRRGLKQLLAETPDIVVTGEAGDARGVLGHVRTQPCDVAVLDLTMPGSNGLDLLEAVGRERPRLPILVLSVHPEDQIAVRVLRAGAAGYLSKEATPEELIGAIRKVHAGRRYVSPRVAERLAADLANPAGRAPHELLSRREYQVLCLIARAKLTKEIARELHLSEKTVSTYRGRLLDKMGLETTAELIRYAIQNRLVE